MVGKAMHGMAQPSESTNAVDIGDHNHTVVVRTPRGAVPHLAVH